MSEKISETSYIKITPDGGLQYLITLGKLRCDFCSSPEESKTVTISEYDNGVTLCYDCFEKAIPSIIAVIRTTLAAVPAESAKCTMCGHELVAGNGRCIACDDRVRANFDYVSELAGRQHLRDMGQCGCAASIRGENNIYDSAISCLRKALGLEVPKP